MPNARKLISLAPLTLAIATSSAAAQSQSFAPEETSIAEVHAAFRAGTITCRSLVSAYLRRIEAFDKNGPAINAIITINPAALATADSLDRRYARDGLVGPLHCIPMIVKDNFETYDMPTSAGNLALSTWRPTRDATMVRRVREAGAIVLAKSNMAELAFSPYETVSSALPGYTKNPYALDRVTAGSSGGTAAAIAASFGVVGLGTDTGNSIRGPSSHQALVGIRSTMGLTSRMGVVPLISSSDIAGPMARSVADAAAVFQVVAGEDAADPVTAASHGRTIPRYADSLRTDGLKGARIGVVHLAYDTPTLDSEIKGFFARALADMTRQGAIIVDPLVIPGLDSLRRVPSSGVCFPFRADFEGYLTSVASSNPPVRTVNDILKTGRFHPSVQVRLESARIDTIPPDANPACKAREKFRDQVRELVRRTMDAEHLDAIAYPTWSNPPRLIGDLSTPAGDNSQFFSPTTGFPAITVPMGYARGALPSGLQLFARPYAEGTLFRLAYAYEQATHHRRPPASTPPLR